MTAAELYDTNPTFKAFVSSWEEHRCCPFGLGDWLEELGQDAERLKCKRCEGDGRVIRPAYDDPGPLFLRCPRCDGPATTPDPSYSLLAQAARWAASFPERKIYFPSEGEDPTPCGLFPSRGENEGEPDWFWHGPTSPTHAHCLPFVVTNKDDVDHPTAVDALLWVLDEAVRHRPWENPLSQNYKEAMMDRL